MSIVIPAHNEAQVIGHLLSQLVSAAEPGEFEIIVVANGCTDNTVEVAAAFAPHVRVLSTPVASKREALAIGNRSAKGFPRLYVDADVGLTTDDARALAEALRRPGALGVGPELTHDMTGRPWTVRWYYDVWVRLPEVRRGLFGRGVVGVSEAGYERISSLPTMLADDLAASLAFSLDERVIVPGARVVVYPPRTFADLMRIRVRAAMGVNQIEQTDGAPSSTARTQPAEIASIAYHQPLLAPRVALFLMVAALARLRARRMAAQGGYSTWLRDDSIRQVSATDNAR